MKVKAFFNHISNNWGERPSVHGALPPFCPPPRQSPFSLKYKQNIGRRMEIIKEV
jgi:hypothetical protein